MVRTRTIYPPRGEHWRFPEPLVCEIEERFSDCLDTDHSAGRSNGVSGIVVGEKPNQGECVHRRERAPRCGLDCRPNVRAQLYPQSTVPNVTPQESKAEDLANFPSPP